MQLLKKLYGHALLLVSTSLQTAIAYLLIRFLACSYIKQCLGSPTPADFEAVLAERDGLQKQLEEANQLIAELTAKVRFLRCSGALEDVLAGLFLSHKQYLFALVCWLFADPDFGSQPIITRQLLTTVRHFQLTMKYLHSTHVG